ncbi:MAG: L-threonine 3-dehydrogenase, partial [Planctomycetes bacterium]|nr:L-threonine 3-dehydrogenase [Planctomycetota bacterium]
MQAVRKLKAAKGLTLCEVPIPQPGPHDCLIQVETASICGTDLHIYNWDAWSSNRLRPPLTTGHEFAGTVVAVGSMVEGIDEGEFVSAESHITCGHCIQCRTGHAHMCPSTRILGVDRDGCFAEFVCVPDKVVWKNDRAKLPPEIATLQEPFGNAVFSTLAHELAGQTLCVFGCGPIGLFSIGIARASGAAAIFASDLNPFRLDLAKTMGATAVHNPATDGSARDWILSVNGGLGPDIVLEMSGAAPAINAAFQVVRNGGRVTLFGIPARPVEIDIAENMIFKNLTVLALNGRRIFETWYKTRWLLESGVVDLRPLITKILPLSSIEESIELLREGNACKIILQPEHKQPLPQL